MSFSGIIKDPSTGLFAGATYLVRFMTFTLITVAMGWAFSAYMPQIPDLAWRFGLAVAMGIALVVLTTNVGETRTLRMFTALFFGAGFVAGMWGLWINAQYGSTIPSVDQLRASFANTTYTVPAFGKPFAVQGYVFEMWAGITLLFASIPLLASVFKPRPAGVAKNPFDVHPDFAQPFGTKLILLPLISFLIAACAVFGFPYAVGFGLPLHFAWVPPLVVGIFYAKLHMRFVKALIVSILGGVGAAAGFWLPWLYLTYGQDGMIAFFQGSPQIILARVEETAASYSYLSEFAGYTSDFSPWTLEIWVGLTLAYLCLPTLITLCRRLSYFVRIG